MKVHLYADKQLAGRSRAGHGNVLRDPVFWIGVLVLLAFVLGALANGGILYRLDLIEKRLEQTAPPAPGPAR